MTRNDGSNLEAAAEAIERLLLEHRHRLEDRCIVIKPRRRQRIEGVLHEFDLWVSVDGIGIFLVECKDWKDPVGKNEVIVFAEKLRATDAVGGYIVARSFTRDARAQAALSSNLTLQIMNQDLESLAQFPHFHEVFQTLVEDQSFPLFIFRGDEEEFPNPHTSDVVHNGESVSVLEARRRFLVRAVDSRMSTEPTAHMEERTYRLTHSEEFRLDPGELTIGDQEVAAVRADVVFDVEVVHPEVFWHYNFVDRGVSKRYRSEHMQHTLEVTFTRIMTDSGETQTAIMTTLMRDNQADD